MKRSGPDCACSRQNGFQRIPAVDVNDFEITGLRIIHDHGISIGQASQVAVEDVEPHDGCT